MLSSLQGEDPTKRTIEAVGKIFIGLLAVGWGLVLIPAGLRRRSERGSFSLLGLGAAFAGLAALVSRRPSRQGSAPLWSTESLHGYTGGPVPPALGIGGMRASSSGQAGRAGQAGQRRQRQMPRAVRRQRHIVLGLLSAAIVTLLLAFVPGLSFFLAIHAVIDVIFALYLVALLRLKQNKGTSSRHALRQAGSSVGGATRANHANHANHVASRNDNQYHRAS
jgi:hypothetical protein